MAVPLAGGGYFFCIAANDAEELQRRLVSEVRVSRILSFFRLPSFVKEDQPLPFLPLVLSVSLEHVNIMTWVSSIVNHRGFLTHQKKALNACFVGRARNIIRALGDSEH